MSFRMLAKANSPPVVTMAGVSILSSVPLLAATSSSPFVGSLSVGALQAANIIAFATNVTSVSIPGRMDDMENNKTNNMVVASRNKSLVTPAGWAFAIWGPIYLGETIFCGSLIYNPAAAAAVLPDFTVPFVAANLLQSLWCASFRPSYYYNNDDDKSESTTPKAVSWWHKYVSVFMLGGTAFSLSNIPFDQLSQQYPYYCAIPIMMHFGWTTAATLVNLNGSLAIAAAASGKAQGEERILIAAGHASSLLATILGVGVTLTYSLPVYGFTISWALAACSNGIKMLNNDDDDDDNKDDKISEAMKTGAKIQKSLLTAGSLISAGASIYTLLLG